MALGRPVRSDVGMTGEVTLNGRVLPIGGVKQKLLAAQRAGLTTVFLPKRNEPDLDEVPGRGARGDRRVLTTDVADLVALAIEPAGRQQPSRRLAGLARRDSAAAVRLSRLRRTLSGAGPAGIRLARLEVAGSAAGGVVLVVPGLDQAGHRGDDQGAR